MFYCSLTALYSYPPQVKAIQARYQSNPEVMQREMSALYSANDVNPLAGCLPSLVQIPIFIGLYRALLKLSTDNLLDEPFLWLPNLQGCVTRPQEPKSWLFALHFFTSLISPRPVYGTQTNDWLFKNWVDGAPSLGWHDTLCFCSLPIILIAMQSVSQKLLQPPPNPVRPIAFSRED
jgi:YidC/Oxa1 family membrane protein insertase